MPKVLICDFKLRIHKYVSLRLSVHVFPLSLSHNHDLALFFFIMFIAKLTDILIRILDSADKDHYAHKR